MLSYELLLENEKNKLYFYPQSIPIAEKISNDMIKGQLVNEIKKILTIVKDNEIYTKKVVSMFYIDSNGKRYEYLNFNNNIYKVYYLDEIIDYIFYSKQFNINEHIKFIDYILSRQYLTDFEQYHTIFNNNDSFITIGTYSKNKLLEIFIALDTIPNNINKSIKNINEKIEQYIFDNYRSIVILKHYPNINQQIYEQIYDKEFIYIPFNITSDNTSILLFREDLKNIEKLAKILLFKYKMHSI